MPTKVNKSFITFIRIKQINKVSAFVDGIWNSALWHTITCIFIKKKKNRQNSLLWLKQTTTTLQFGLAEKEQWFLLGETNNDQGYRLLTI